MGIKAIIKNVKAAGNVLINGNTVEIRSGENITISGNQVKVGGKTITVDDPHITIAVTGDVGSIDGVGDINVSGNVGGEINTSSGNIEVGGNVDGDIDCSCGNVTVKGHVKGDVDCACGNVKVGK